MNPPNAGDIYCNNKHSSNYTRYGLGTQLECKAIANNGFQFSLWSTDLRSISNNNPGISTANSEHNNNNNDTVTEKFSVTKYGTLNANFINSVPISIPQEYLVGLYGVILSFIIPSIAMWINAKRQRGYLKRYIEKIDDIYEESNHTHKPDEYLKRLDDVEKEITLIYTKGKISDSHYNVLKDKVSEYKQNVK